MKGSRRKGQEEKGKKRMSKKNGRVKQMRGDSQDSNLQTKGKGGTTKNQGNQVNAGRFSRFES